VVGGRETGLGMGIGASRAILGVRSYEGLPPEVGAFKFEKGGHAPWPVHNFRDFSHFYANFRIRGVGVIPWVSMEVGGWR